MSLFELPYVSVTYEAPVVIFKYRDGAQIGFPEVKQLVSIAEQASGGLPYVTFSDVRADVNVTEQGRRYVADLRNMPLFRGSAVLVKSSMVSFTANFLSGFKKKAYPFRAFFTEEKAMEWLRSLKME